MLIDAAKLEFKELNEKIRNADNDIELTSCIGQRFIAAGMDSKKLNIHGIPGNALGAYLNGAEISVHGNAQDAVGDTMNDGSIFVHGNIGDAAGYAMRGGRIYVKGNAGYRAGIHMKAYKEKHPTLVIGGSAGSFLGEYQAGGTIIVLGLNDEKKIVGNFPCTGMHGGKMFLRGRCKNIKFPGQVTTHIADDNDKKEIESTIRDFCNVFGINADEVLDSDFTVVLPDTNNPFKQMYVAN
ncbi:MAG: glutamate synthase [Clostridiales bacterium]|nr:glutamate synthase [Clostridiales bacterium]